MRVRWQRPFEADPDSFHHPITMRCTGLLDLHGGDSTLVANNLTADTTFLDTGLNTEDNVYNYSVTAYASNNDRSW